MSTYDSKKESLEQLLKEIDKGTIPEKYLLQEMATKDYLRRTEANVVDSDATVVFTKRDPQKQQGCREPATRLYALY